MSAHYHFVGIGGVGMGALAALMLSKGFKVSGSDVKSGAITQTLQQSGAAVCLGHDALNIAGADYVVYSSAISAENPELAAARARGIPILQRAQLLARLMEGQSGITVAGAHGKTTTSSMIALLMIKAGLKPTTAVGGITNGGAYQSELGDGHYFVAEVDESDGSFLYFKPRYSVVTNIDFEHVDYYHTWANIVSAYRKFIEQTAEGGKVIICGEDGRLRQLAAQTGQPVMTYGLSPACDVWADQVVITDHLGGATRFDCIQSGRLLGQIELHVPGAHNVLNALACVSVGLNLGLDFSTIREAVAEFRGVRRRFQLKGNVKGVMVVDDYGHHPTEIAATLATARSLNPQRLITVFQPHRYTRTKFLMDEFVQSLGAADHLVITDIYAASEPAMEGVSAEILVERCRREHHRPAHYFPKQQILAHLLDVVRPGDLVIILGAGDIYQVGEQLVNALAQSVGQAELVRQKI